MNKRTGMASTFVIAGFDPAIEQELFRKIDARVKPAHDG
jgi:hypothetical protein